MAQVETNREHFFFQKKKTLISPRDAKKKMVLTCDATDQSYTDLTCSSETNISMDQFSNIIPRRKIQQAQQAQQPQQHSNSQQIIDIPQSQYGSMLALDEEQGKGKEKKVDYVIRTTSVDSLNNSNKDPQSNNSTHTNLHDSSCCTEQSKRGQCFRIKSNTIRDEYSESSDSESLQSSGEHSPHKGTLLHRMKDKLIKRRSWEGEGTKRKRVSNQKSPKVASSSPRASSNLITSPSKRESTREATFNQREEEREQMFAIMDQLYDAKKKKTASSSSSSSSTDTTNITTTTNHSSTTTTTTSKRSHLVVPTAPGKLYQKENVRQKSNENKNPLTRSRSWDSGIHRFYQTEEEERMQLEKEQTIQYLKEQIQNKNKKQQAVWSKGKNDSEVFAVLKVKRISKNPRIDY